ncbi:MAG: hypothetical protein R3F62_30980 [Planctomycetota bacterium]
MNDRRTPKLHELLAVEQERKGNADRLRTQTVETFRTSQHHFMGQRRTFRPFAVDEAQGEAAGERLEAETRLVKTVSQELDGFLRGLGQWVDVGYQIDQANTEARADLTLNGEVLAEGVPATFLLQLEKRLREIRSVFKEVPTFDPVRIWTPDPGADKAHVLRAEPVITVRKQRARKYNVMVEATKEHPAQVDVVEVDQPVGEIRSHEWTGLISPRQKQALLDQVETLIGAVKRARARANEGAVDPARRIADALRAFLLAPIQESS